MPFASVVTAIEKLSPVAVSVITKAAGLLCQLFTVAARHLGSERQLRARLLLIGVNGNLNCFAIGNRHQAAQGICVAADQQLFRRIDFGHGVGARVRRLFQEEEAFLIILLAEEHDLFVVITTMENGILRLVGFFQFSFRADSAAVGR